MRIGDWMGMEMPLAIESGVAAEFTDPESWGVL